MSRIGNSPITVPSGVDVTVDQRRVTVKGPKGSLERSLPEEVTIREDGATLIIERVDDESRSRSMHGLARTLVDNMVVGVTEGFVKELEIIGVGYRATAQGSDKIDMALGFSHPVVIEAPEGISFEVPAPNRIIIRGSDKEAVGQMAADIRQLRRPEPYKGKGIRYVDEHVARKAGKSGK